MDIEQYHNRLTLAGYRPRTVTERVKCLRQFETSLRVPITEATRRDVEAFLSRPLAAESRRTYRAHLRGFYGWLLDEGIISADPTAKIPPIRVPTGAPRPVGDADLAVALARAAPRMRAWLLLMALAGLRCLEVSALRPQDLIVSDVGALLYLRECKGGGTGTVPAHPAIVAALLALPVRNGVWWTCQPDTVSKYVSRFLRSCVVDATGHQLRHWAGTSWYRASEHDVLTTAELLRHRSIRTTQVYSQFDPVRPAQVVGMVALPFPASLGLGSAI